MLEDCLDDLAVRFLLYLPDTETSTFARLGFHLEQAYWFYLDIYHQPHPAHYPNLSMEHFVRLLLQRCDAVGHRFPALMSSGGSGDSTGNGSGTATNTTNSTTTGSVKELLDTFAKYKAAVPVCGAALVTSSGDKVLMVRGVGKRSRWGFPRGKINKDEPPWQCARRECLEECGFDPAQVVDCTTTTTTANTTTNNNNNNNTSVPHIDVLLEGKPVRLYVVVGVSEEERFAPRTRNEIGAIAWHRLSDLPTRSNHANSRHYHHVVPFAKRLRQIVQTFVRAGVSRYCASGAGGNSNSGGTHGHGTTTGTRVSILELLHSASIATTIASNSDTIIDEDDAASDTDSHASNHSSDDSSDPLQDMMVTPVWSGDSSALLRLLTNSTHHTIDDIVGREECVRRIGQRVPARGLTSRQLDAIMDSISGILNGD